MYATDSEGGCGMAFRPGLPPATLVYMPHSAVVSCFESAILRPKGRMMAGDVSDPPKKQGGHAVPHRWHLGHAFVPDPMGSLTSSFIPAGRLGIGQIRAQRFSRRKVD